MIQNYPGLPEISGAELAEKLLEHLRVMEIPITDRKVNAVYAMGDFFSLQIDQEFWEASAVILAGGVSFGKPFPGEDENLGRGVSYCATCDAALYRGRSAVVVGYAPKEEDDASFLAEIAEKVYYLPVYKEEPHLSGDNIEIVHSAPVSIEKTENGMKLNMKEGSITADGIFLLRESVAPDKLVPGLALDGNHVKVDRRMAANLPGLFAAGDITGTPYQYIKAAGEGNVAALSAVSYLDSLRKKA
jgi:thioredoxin reductase (NADPH)